MFLYYQWLASPPSDQTCVHYSIKHLRGTSLNKEVEVAKPSNPPLPPQGIVAAEYWGPGIWTLTTDGLRPENRYSYPHISYSSGNKIIATSFLQADQLKPHFPSFYVN